MNQCELGLTVHEQACLRNGAVVDPQVDSDDHKVIGAWVASSASCYAQLGSYMRSAISYATRAQALRGAW